MAPGPKNGFQGFLCSGGTRNQCLWYPLFDIRCGATSTGGAPGLGAPGATVIRLPEQFLLSYEDINNSVHAPKYFHTVFAVFEVSSSKSVSNYGKQRSGTALSFLYCYQMKKTSKAEQKKPNETIRGVYLKKKVKTRLISTSFCSKSEAK